MSRARVTRRLTALTGVTALLSAAGLATGALVGVANAQTVTTVSPSAVSNAGTAVTTLTISGAGFTAALDTVTLNPTVSGDEVAPITATVSTTASSATSLVVTAPLHLAAPVPYDVVVSQSGLPGATVATCSACLNVTNPARATVTGVAADGGAGSILVSGTNFARGAKLAWLLPTGAVDPALTFKAGHDTTANGRTTHTTGYPSATAINGVYTPGANAVPGLHYLRVTNLDGQASTQAVPFFQPAYTSVTPTTVGQGAVNAPVTVTGAGIRAGSRLSLSNFSSTAADITVGTSVVTGDTTLTAPVSVAAVGSTNEGGPSQRTAYILGPDGGYAAHPSVTVTAPPTPTALSGDTLGQGAKAVPATITGTGFAQGVAFAINGTGVTVKTVSTTATQASVTLTVAGDAAIGDRDTLTATNPDYGTAALVGDGTPVVGTAYPLTITAGPVIKTIKPSGLTPGSSKSVTLTGTGFDTAGITLTSSTPDVTFSAVKAVNATTATATLTAATNAPQGPRDVTITNTADHGSSVCVGCIGVDGLTVSPTVGPNTSNDFDLTVTAASGSSFAGATGVTLHKTGGLADQPDLVAKSASATTGIANFDLTHAAPGPYDVSVTGTTVSCTGCFTITGTEFTPTSVAPATGGQGAKDFPITITGTNFVRGETVTIAGTTVSPTTYVSPTTLTATITIPQNATVGQAAVQVTSADGAVTHPIANGYAIVAAPTLTGPAASDHRSVGQGAANQGFALTGTGFSVGHVAVTVSGAGVTGPATATSATAATLAASVAGDAPIGARDVSITNTDNGGTSVPLAGALTVSAKPAVSLVTPSKLVAGRSTAVTISGQGFQPGASAALAGATFGDLTVSADGTSISTTITVDKSASGVRTLSVNNTDGGKGTCASCVAFVVPTAVTNVLSGATIAGRTVAEHGVLTNTNTGEAVPNATLTLTIVPRAGATRVVHPVTNNVGAWTYSYAPSYTSTATISFGGSSTAAAPASVSRTIAVAAGITLTSPRGGSSSKAGSAVLVKGSITPNKAGRTVYLYKVTGKTRSVLTKTAVAKNGTYVLGIRLKKGAYTLQVSLPADTRNTIGNSRPISYHST